MVPIYIHIYIYVYKTWRLSLFVTYFFVTAALVAKVVAESIETYRVLGNLVEVLL